MRLDKFLSEQKIASRSQLKEQIKKGFVTVNGITAAGPELHIDPDQDQIAYKGKVLNRFSFRYLMLNKPAGVVSATRDEKNKTVLDLLPVKLREGLFPVGRLDKDTEGLLLLTDDGELAHRLLSPRKHVDKTYLVRTDHPIQQKQAEALKGGLDIGEKRLTMAADVEVSANDAMEALITIREGKYHQIKRMFEAVGLKVIYLKRLKMGTLSLDEALIPGKYRPLTKEETEQLKGLTGHAAK